MNVTDKLLQEIVEHPGTGWTSLEVDLATELLSRRAAKVEKVSCCQCNWSNTGLLNMAQEPGYTPEWWCHGCLQRLINAYRDETVKFIKLADTAKVEKVEPVREQYWTGSYSGYRYKTRNNIKEACMGCDPKCGEDKTKPVVYGGQYYCATCNVHHKNGEPCPKPEPELTPEELRECGMPETRSCENCGNGPYNGETCQEFPLCGKEGGSGHQFESWIPKPKPAVGEGVIAALTLADVPIGAVAVIRTAKAVWGSLVVAKSAGYTFVGNAIKWPDTRIVERWYWPQDAVNRMREEK